MAVSLTADSSSLLFVYHLMDQITPLKVAKILAQTPRSWCDESGEAAIR
jgi:hypothetical protein